MTFIIVNVTCVSFRFLVYLMTVNVLVTKYIHVGLAEACKKHAYFTHLLLVKVWNRDPCQVRKYLDFDLISFQFILTYFLNAESISEAYVQLSMYLFILLVLLYRSLKVSGLMPVI